MLQFGEYTIAWLIYFGATMGLLVVTHRLFREFSGRHFIVVAVAAILLTPAIGLENYWAPAWIIGSLELLFSGLEGALPAARIILIVGFAALLIVALAHLVSLMWRRALGKSDSNKASVGKIQ